jgi:predicted AAA+ superfamily ATPase
MNTTHYINNPWWENKPFETGIKREKYLQQFTQNFEHRLIQIITGLRRVGKSTLVKQAIAWLLEQKKIAPQDIFWFSLDNPILAEQSIAEIIDEFRAEFAHPVEKEIYAFIDEVQFRTGWELEIKSLYDTQNIKFILNGSSAVLLSEKVSALTGRFLKIDLYPLDFEEYLQFVGVSAVRANPAIIIGALQEYLLVGGMPEFVLSRPANYLRTTVESILFKDLVSKFNLRNPKILEDILLLLADRVGTVSSSLKLAKVLEINKDTILDYINYLEMVFLLGELSTYSTSRNKQIYNPPKIYFQDLGILSSYSSKFNYGAGIENLIYNFLMQQTKNDLHAKLGYWYEDKVEVDFLLAREGGRMLIDVKWINDVEEANLKSIELAMKACALKEAYIITRNCKSEVKLASGSQIKFIPAYEVLLGWEKLF